MSETYVYDAAGNLKSKIDFNGKTTTYTYDVSNRLASKVPDASFSAPTVSFAYMATGQRQSMVDASGTTNYTYDLRDRLTQRATPEGTLSYLYDAAGNLTSIQSSNASGTTVNYAYDPLNRLSTVKDNRLASGTTSYAYDNVGNLSGYQYPNGVQSKYSYNMLNRLTNLGVASSGSTIASYAYTLGPTGNRTAVAEFGGRQVNYTYDFLYRLTGEAITGSADTTKNGTIGYIYDPVGNRLQRTSTLAPVPPTSSTYDANDRLTTDTYDTNGNTTASGSNAYTYDFENHLSTLNTSAEAIVYDGDGNRVAKTAGGVTTQYLVDDRNLTGYGQVLEELSGGTVLRVYTYGLNRISESQASGTSFYGYDGHGNVRLLTDTTGAVTDRYDYDAFGNILSQAGATPNVYLFSGEQSDSNLALYYLRARYLSQSTGRFWTMDTDEGDPDSPISLHKYTYVGNEPVRRLDPGGNQFDIASVSLEIAIAAVVLTVPDVVEGGGILKTVKQRLGLEGIFLQGHGVLGSSHSHSFLRVTPADQTTWLRGRPAAFPPKNTDSFGNRFATIGAGPANKTPPFGKLTKGINRGTDVTDPTWLNIRLNVLPNDENKVIATLFDLYDKYNNDLDYHPLYPVSGNGYNSNSFVMGLLNAAGLSNPVYALYEDVFPGWGKPVPPNEFGIAP